jgi:hypothetical protein
MLVTYASSVTRRISVVLALACALAFVPAASAKLSLHFDRATARPGERVQLTFGQYFTTPDHVIHVYLVRASILGRVIRPAQGGGGSRLGPPPRLSGVVKVGRTSSAKPGFAFRVPGVRPGRYAAAIWCSTCPYPYVLASFPGSVPDDAYVRAGRTLLRVVR